MANYRKGKINEAIAKELSDLLRTVKDYRLEGAVISVTSVNCAPDLSLAKVYYSYLGSASQKDIRQGLNSASGYLRTGLARRLDLRQTPKLVFEYDDSMAHGAHITGILRKVEEELKAADERDARLAQAESESAALEESNHSEEDDDE